MRKLPLRADVKAKRVLVADVEGIHLKKKEIRADVEKAAAVADSVSRVIKWTTAMSM